MTVTPAQISSFKALYAKEYGRELDDRKAQELAKNLLGLYRVVYAKIPPIKVNERLDISRLI